MTTETLVKPANAKEEEPLIQSNNAREALLMKLNGFKTQNRSAKEEKEFQQLNKDMNKLFGYLCWSKLGVSSAQWKNLEQKELNELAVMIYERSSVVALVHTIILACVPLVGWGIIGISIFSPNDFKDLSLWQNMRYYWWYKRMENKFGKDFKPTIQGRG